MIGSYPGGKASTKKHSLLYENIPPDIKVMIEPFAGLGHVSINLQLVYGYNPKKYWLNDKNPNIVALLRVIKNKDLLKKLFEFLENLSLTKEEYSYWKNNRFDTLLEQAIQTMIILNCSFSGAGGGFSKQKASRPWRKTKRDVFLKIHPFLRQAKITNYDYMKVLKLSSQYFDSYRSDETFIYLDPPYRHVAKKHNLYFAKYNNINWEELFKILNEAEYKWLLSSNNDIYIKSLIKQKYKHFYFLSYPVKSSMGKEKQYEELLISNYPLRILS